MGFDKSKASSKTSSNGHKGESTKQSFTSFISRFKNASKSNNGPFEDGESREKYQTSKSEKEHQKLKDEKQADSKEVKEEEFLIKKCHSSTTVEILQVSYALVEKTTVIKWYYEKVVKLPGTPENRRLMDLVQKTTYKNDDDVFLEEVGNPGYHHGIPNEYLLYRTAKERADVERGIARDGWKLTCITPSVSEKKVSIEDT